MITDYTPPVATYCLVHFVKGNEQPSTTHPREEYIRRVPTTLMSGTLSLRYWPLEPPPLTGRTDV